MIRLGEKQTLHILKQKTFGAYLGTDYHKDDGILLPIKQVPEGAELGDALEVFIYRDSMDRLIATTKTPKIKLGEIALLEVKQITEIGAFLDWGLEKDLLLPFKEQTTEIEEGKSYLVALYIDKSERLCATMKIYDYLTTSHDYKKDDRVSGYVYQINKNFGAFVAVDYKLHGLIAKHELPSGIVLGTVVEARVVAIREDGKMELSLREKIGQQIDIDAKKILDILDSYAGVLPFTEKASPEVINRETGLSKASFKRAVGRLLKNREIEIINGKIKKS